MKRREFVTLLGGLAPYRARAAAGELSAKNKFLRMITTPFQKTNRDLIDFRIVLLQHQN